MIKHPKISVVIPAFNEEKYLADCLESLQNQSLHRANYEVIVVDNNSSDKTAEIAENYGIRVVGCQTQGVAAARAVGSEAAYGEIIAGTDADTAVSNNWLEKILFHFHNDHELVGLTGPAYLKKTNFLFSKSSYIAFDLFQRFNFLIGKPTFSGFNYAVKAEAYGKIGGINPDLASAEDIDLSFRLAKEGKVRYFSDVLVYTSGRRIQKDPIGFFRHNLTNYYLMIRGKNPEPFKPIR
ncbi:MAG: glycosyltransferase family A protein [Candidatus Woykebacteria bacterium]